MASYSACDLFDAMYLSLQLLETDPGKVLEFSVLLMKILTYRMTVKIKWGDVYRVLSKPMLWLILPMKEVSHSDHYGMRLGNLPTCLKQWFYNAYRMQIWFLLMEVWVAFWEAALHIWNLHWKETDSWSTGQCLEVILNRCKIKLIASQFHALIQIRSRLLNSRAQMCIWILSGLGVALDSRVAPERFVHMATNWHFLYFKWTDSQKIICWPSVVKGSGWTHETEAVSLIGSDKNYAYQRVCLVT